MAHHAEGGDSKESRGEIMLRLKDFAQDYDLLPEDDPEEVRAALEEWDEYAAAHFVEMTDEGVSDTEVQEFLWLCPTGGKAEELKNARRALNREHVRQARE